MEIKGLNQNEVADACDTKSNEIEKAITFLCPILLQDNELKKIINHFVFNRQIQAEELLGTILETYDYLPFENLENLIMILNGFKIISHENGFSTNQELDEYFKHQVGQIAITDDKKKITLCYRNESNSKYN